MLVAIMKLHLSYSRNAKYCNQCVVGRVIPRLGGQVGSFIIMQGDVRFECCQLRKSGGMMLRRHSYGLLYFKARNVRRNYALFQTFNDSHLPLQTGNSQLYIKEDAKKKKTAIFWDITQKVVVIPYRRFGTTCHIFRGQGKDSYVLLNTFYK
jgi:hypothetical protein